MKSEQRWNRDMMSDSKLFIHSLGGRPKNESVQLQADLTIFFSRGAEADRNPQAGNNCNGEAVLPSGECVVRRMAVQGGGSWQVCNWIYWGDGRRRIGVSSARTKILEIILRAGAKIGGGGEPPVGHRFSRRSGPFTCRFSRGS